MKIDFRKLRAAGYSASVEETEDRNTIVTIYGERPISTNDFADMESVIRRLRPNLTEADVDMAVHEMLNSTEAIDIVRTLSR